MHWRLGPGTPRSPIVCLGPGHLPFRRGSGQSMNPISSVFHCAVFLSSGRWWIFQSADFALHANNHSFTVVRRLHKTATVTSSVWMAAYPDFPHVSNARSQQSLLARYPMTPLLPGANAATPRAAYLVAVQNRREAIKTVTHTALDLATASQYEHALLTHLAAPVAGTHTSSSCSVTLVVFPQCFFVTSGS